MKLKCSSLLGVGYIPHKQQHRERDPTCESISKGDNKGENKPSSCLLNTSITGLWRIIAKTTFKRRRNSNEFAALIPIVCIKVLKHSSSKDNRMDGEDSMFFAMDDGSR